MPWNQSDVQKHMEVYSADDQKLGHVAEVYQDSFLVRKGIFFLTDRYIPYSAIRSIDNKRVQLTMEAEDARDREWKKRPAYEKHPGDVLQHFYDRGHGVQDPYEESGLS